MPTANVYNMAGEKVGTVELSEAIFGIKPNKVVLHTAVKNHLANRRQGTQSTLTRAEVSGGGRKPWRQKGTGRARAGSTRAPHWTHGGLAFAPKPRDYSYNINKKVRRLALKSALSAKAGETAIYVIDTLKLDEIKTKQMAELLAKLELGGKKAMVITPERDENVYKSARNIEGVQVTFGGILNPYDILNARALVIDQAALAKIEEVFA
ncbi:MAG: 50S ribosomal protein L4 [Oscillospiraceae bacterium]|nr:50S ribosomal protein L4 [Oscillospiraceae bacterium]